MLKLVDKVREFFTTTDEEFEQWYLGGKIVHKEDYKDIELLFALPEKQTVDNQITFKITLRYDKTFIVKECQPTISMNLGEFTRDELVNGLLDGSLKMKEVEKVVIEDICQLFSEAGILFIGKKSFGVFKTYPIIQHTKEY